jgi:hypothetical protein
MYKTSIFYHSPKKISVFLSVVGVQQLAAACIIAKLMHSENPKIG